MYATYGQTPDPKKAGRQKMAAARRARHKRTRIRVPKEDEIQTVSRKRTRITVPR